MAEDPITSAVMGTPRLLASQGWLGLLTMFEVASAAVEAALAAGARYADARAMHQRNESMAARNGDVEDLAQRESVGVGVRALVGSSWGFVAVPDPTDAGARRAGGSHGRDPGWSAPPGNRAGRPRWWARSPHRPGRSRPG